MFGDQESDIVIGYERSGDKIPQEFLDRFRYCSIDSEPKYYYLDFSNRT